MKNLHQNTFDKFLNEAKDSFDKIKKGLKFRWNNKEWTVTAIKGGDAVVRAQGIPAQKVDILKLSQWIDDGKAKVLGEARLKNPHDKAYQTLIKRARKEIPWDAKPEKSVTSALHGLGGTVNGVQVYFTWHQPDTRWGPNWIFAGGQVGNQRFEKAFRKYGDDLRKDINAPVDHDLSLGEFESFIKAAKKVK